MCLKHKVEPNRIPVKHSVTFLFVSTSLEVILFDLERIHNSYIKQCPKEIAFSYYMMVFCI